MQMSHHIHAIQEDLAAAASLAADEPTAEAGRRLTQALGSSLHLRLLDVVNEAALALSDSVPGRIEVRLAGRDPELVYVEEEEAEPEPRPRAATIPSRPASPCACPKGSRRRSRWPRISKAPPSTRGSCARFSAGSSREPVPSAPAGVCPATRTAERSSPCPVSTPIPYGAGVLLVPDWCNPVRDERVVRPPRAGRRPAVHAFDTPGKPRLRVSNSAGLVTVEAAETGQTTVELEALRDDDATREAIERATVELHGNEVRVEIGVGGKGFGVGPAWISFGRTPQVGIRIRCPEGSDLDCTTASADVGRHAAGSARSRRRPPRGTSRSSTSLALRVQSASGDVRSARRRRRGAHPDRLRRRAPRHGRRRRSRRRSSRATSRPTRAGPTWPSRPSPATSAIDAIREGQIKLQSVSGDVRLGVRPGTRLQIDANSTSGDISSEFDVRDRPSDGADRRRGAAADQDRQRRRRDRPRARPSAPMRRPGGLWRHPDFLTLWSARRSAASARRSRTSALPFVAIVVLKRERVRGRPARHASFLPFLLFALPAGVWVDRLRAPADPRRLRPRPRRRPRERSPSPTARRAHDRAALRGRLRRRGRHRLLRRLVPVLPPSLVGRDQLVDGNSKLELSRTASQIAGPGLAGALIGLLRRRSRCSSTRSASSSRRSSSRAFHDGGAAAAAERRSMRAELMEGLRFLLAEQYAFARLPPRSTIFNFFSNVTSRSSSSTRCACCTSARDDRAPLRARQPRLPGRRASRPPHRREARRRTDDRRSEPRPRPR